MNRRDLFRAALAGVLPAPRWLLEHGVAGTTALPATYIIDYAYDHLDNPAFIDKVAASPPNILHLGHDVPFTGHWGPRSVPLPVKDEARYALLSPEATAKRYDAIERMLRALHRGGVDVVIPYVDNQQMGGDIEKRLGFWEFYDHWDEYRRFGLPPRPTADPTEWLQRDPDGQIHFNNPAAYPSYEPQFFHAPCPNNEHWMLYLKFVIQKIAACGFDGLFVDDNILHCYCRYCRQGFQRYLRSRYTPDALRRSFSTDDVTRLELHWQADKPYWAKSRPEFREYLRTRYRPGEFEKRFKIQSLDSILDMNRIGYGFLNGRANEFLEYLQKKYTPRERKQRFGLEDLHLLGIETPRDRLLWFETQRFWAWSIAENLLFLHRAAAAINPDFLMLPNWGSMQNVGAIDGRRLHAKNVAEWTRGCDYLMFEEDWRDGMPGPRRDHQAQYKFALANGVRPVVLFGGQANASVAELAHAEAAAGGGGAFVSDYRFPELRRAYRQLYSRHPDLFAGLESVAPVAVAFFFDQAHMENIAHLRHLYAIHPRLGREHVLFDFLTEQTLDRAHLERYRALILPNIVYLQDRHARLIEEWAGGGGNLIVTGECGARFDKTKATFLPQPDSLDAALLARLTGEPVQWTDRADLPALRANVYRARTRLTIHLLNYDVQPIPSLQVSIPLPHAGPKLIGIRMHSPSQQPTPLQGEIRANCLKFAVPDLRVYRLIEAQLRT